jgi:preprotein translocase SecE subunit
MSRQLRRHPIATKPTKPRPIRPALRNPKSIAPGREGGRRGLAAMRPAWVEDVFSELRKVQWPTPQEAWNLTIVVIVVCIAFGVAAYLVDTIFIWALQHTILR